ncbi:MAG TPA: biotin/lipoyl-containing protein [Thermoanaerobaculia bacterium]|nr:biotin/lipoyl-containing protein [Thermoanaerobaculia bacterium]
MELWVKLGEREERVRIRRDGDLFEVAIGEVVHRVEAAVLGRGTYSLRLEGIQSEVAVRASGEDRLRVTAATSAWEVEIADPLAHLAAIAGGGGARKRHRKVAAYMPGRVVAVLVEPGTEVAAGQGIVVLEAMKMQNEIQAEHDGTIKSIFVQPGQAVEGGDPLFELE